MNDSIELPDPNTIEAEAAEWIARLDRGDLSEEECVALREWIGRGPEHYAMLYRFAGIWSGLDGLEDILEDVKAPASVKRLHREQRWLTPIKAAVFTVSIISVIVGVFFSSSNHFRATPVERWSWQASYITGIGEQQTITFQDGSRTQLNTDTMVNIDFNERQRKVHLVKGEALFEVGPDESRHFMVYAGSNVIYVMGTAFTVKLMEDQVEVTIREGRIEIKPLLNDAQKHPDKELNINSTILKAGQTVIINEKIRLLKEIESEEMDRKLAWSEGLVIFSGEPLSYVIEEISRYTPIKFVITDPELSRLRVGGRFKIGETAALLEILETGFGVNIKRVGNDLVYLSSGIQE